MNGNTKKRKRDNLQACTRRFFDAIKTNNWVVVEEILKQPNGKDILQYSENLTLNETCLRLRFMYTNIPIHVFELCYKLSPEFRLKTDRNGNSVFHNVCLAEKCDDIVTDFFVKQNVCSVMMRADDGSLPLHCAIRAKKKSYTIKMLISANTKSIHVADKKGHTPFNVFFETWNHIMVQMRSQYRGKFEDIPKTNNDYEILQQVKDTFLDLLYTIKYDKPREKDNAMLENWLPLHESIQNKEVPNIYLILLSSTIPEQLSRKDESGNLPHHLLLFRESLSVHDMIYMYNKHKHGVLEQNRDGIYPLTLAIELQRNWNVIESISRLGPQVVSTRDEKTKFYPFMLAATKVEDENARVNAVYGLFRWNPFLIRLALP